MRNYPLVLHALIIAATSIPFNVKSASNDARRELIAVHRAVDTIANGAEQIAFCGLKLRPPLTPLQSQSPSTAIASITKIPSWTLVTTYWSYTTETLLEYDTQVIPHTPSTTRATPSDTEIIQAPLADDTQIIRATLYDPRASAPTNFPPNTNWHYGLGTYYQPNGGFGSCEIPLQNSDFVCAIRQDIMDAAPRASGGTHSSLCGMKIEVGEPGKHTILVTVMDSCPSCTDLYAVDLAEGAYRSLAELGAMPIRWRWIL